MAKGNKQQVDCKWCDASGWIDQESQLDCEHCEGDGWVWESPGSGGAERVGSTVDPCGGIDWLD